MKPAGSANTSAINRLKEIRRIFIFETFHPANWGQLKGRGLFECQRLGIRFDRMLTSHGKRDNLQSWLILRQSPLKSLF
jgi:hypothetical protein